MISLDVVEVLAHKYVLNNGRQGRYLLLDKTTHSMLSKLSFAKQRTIDSDGTVTEPDPDVASLKTVFTNAGELRILKIETDETIVEVVR